jgi:very-short-patch-repair endonuclease
MKNINNNLPMFYGASANIQARAKELRKRMTKTEKILWEIIRNKQILNEKFRRQHPIDIFIADFYCHKLKFVIELDGEIHNIPENIEKDKNRTLHLETLGITIIRFTNIEVENKIDWVVSEIALKIKHLACPLQNENDASILNNTTNEPNLKTQKINPTN